MISLFIDLPPQKGYDIVHRFWQGKLGGDASIWNRSLNKGVVMNVAPNVLPLPMPVTEVASPPSVPIQAGSDFEILFRPDAAVDDGRYANNGWLQELPRPLTKLTWDNVAMISPNSAKLLSVKMGDVVQLTTGGDSISAPTWIQPGHADGCVSVTLGYGRTKAGEVANGVGFNANLPSFYGVGLDITQRADRENGTHA